MSPESATNFSQLSYWEYLYLCGVVPPLGKLGGPKVAASPKSDKKLYKLYKKGLDCTNAEGCLSEPLLHREEQFQFVLMCILHLVIRLVTTSPNLLGRIVRTFHRPLGIVFKIASVVPRPKLVSRAMPLRMGKRHGSCWQIGVILARCSSHMRA